MAVFDNLQELIDILDGAPGISELTIMGQEGAQITLKRSIYVSAPQPQEFDPSFSVTQPSALAQFPEPTTMSSQPADVSVTISANRVGVFRPAKPMIAVGDTIASGQIVGYVESMKLLNEVLSETAGNIVEQLVDDEMPVEYGQPLFRLSPAAA